MRRRYFSAFLFPIVLVVVLSALKLLDFEGVYGQDSYEYVRYADAWRLYFAEGTPPGDYPWPVNYPAVGGFLSWISGAKAAVCLQLLSLISLIFSAFLMVRCIKLLFPEKKELALHWVLIAFLFVPYFFRTGIVCMSDQFAAMSVVACFYAMLRIVKSERAWYWLAFAFFAGLAVMTRYVSALLILPMLIYLLPQFAKRRNWIPLLASLVLVAVPLMPHYMIRAGQLFTFTAHDAILDWDFRNFFRRTFERDFGRFDYTVPNALYLLSPFGHAGFLWFGALLLPFYRGLQRNRDFWLLLSLVVPMLLFLGGIDLQNHRFFTPILPFVCLLLYPLFVHAMSWLEMKHRTLPTAIFFLLLGSQIGLSAYSAYKPMQTYHADLQMSSLLTSFRGETVYTYGTSSALGYLEPQNEYVTLYQKEDLNPEGGTYILFNEQWLAGEKLTELPPVQVFERLQQANRLEVATRAGDWTLYRVTN